MSFRLSRRAFLGGAGAAIALPYLEAMAPRTMRERAKAQEDRRVRLAWVWVPHGIIRRNFTPTTEGAGYAMPSMLRPLEDMRDHFSVISGLHNRPGQGRYTYADGTVSDDGPGDHARDTATFLTCARIRKTSGSDIRNGQSIDILAAQHLREYTPEIPNLVLSTFGGYGGDSGYAPIYQANLSWVNETTPAERERSPRAVFERLFAGFDPGESAIERDRRIALERSVLDGVLDDVRRLRGRLGTRDNEKLDEYLEGIRALEVRLDSEPGRSCDPGSPPPESGYDFPTHVQLFFDVMALAFQCDRTRVVSMMMQKQGSVHDHITVGGNRITSNHHAMSHLESGNTDIQRIEAINAWQVEQFGRLLRTLQRFEEGDGTTLLDNTLVLFGGGLDGTGHRSGTALGDLTPQQSGPVHRHTNLPILLGGHGRGAVRTGRHIVVEGGAPLPNLYISMLHAAGIEVNRFALEGNGPLSGLG
ncbi:MAG: DUF1552 domain-containing protein [Myxococcales bacterium]|nr:DUF1552 domain-containing protein [Myxococcales bacterium]